MNVWRTMVGMVQKVFVDPETKKINLIQVLNCPPKGASMDNLYVDINAEQAFHLRYKVKVMDTIERSMLLAINLEINKSDGNFSKIFKRKSGTKHSSSLYSTAKNVIQHYYQLQASTSSEIIS